MSAGRVCVKGMRMVLEDGFQIRKWREEECFIKARAKRACVFIKRAPAYKNKLFCGFMQWPHAGRAALLTRGRFAQAGGR